MSPAGDYFFCGVGGSGMTPLALIIQAKGGLVEGSDRALDQGRNTKRFDFLRARGVLLHPQDGSGVTRASQIVVTSTAVEETVPDVQAARLLVPPSSLGAGFSPNSSTLPPWASVSPAQ
jgi:UDP-N-acetylmuramate--alanine ligase